MTVFRTFFSIFLLALSLVLGACDSLNYAPPPPPCPKVSILAEASTNTVFQKGAGRDLIDVHSEGEITGFSGGCNYDLDRETGDGTLTLEVSPDFEVKRGPANQDRQAKFDYFVIVVDSEQTTLAKEVFAVETEFSGTQTRRRFTDDNPPVTLEIPLTAARKGDTLQIYIGFQLSPEELEFNRYQRKVGLR